MRPSQRAPGALTSALYLDLPYIIDSIWRRGEYNANRWFQYRAQPAPDGTVSIDIAGRSLLRLPPFWLFLIVLVFVAYGPTLDSLCSILSPGGMRIARLATGAGLVAIAAGLLLQLNRYASERCNKRFFKAKVQPSEKLRRGVVRFFAHAGLSGLALPIVLVGLYLYRKANLPVCHVVPSATPAVLQLIIAAVAMALTAIVAQRRGPANNRASWFFLLLALVVAILWLWVAGPAATEAMQTPYPHVYGVFSLALAALAAVAPWWARFQFRSIIDAERRFYAQGLAAVELFPSSRVDPVLSTQRIIAASVVGTCYHVLPLLLLPCLFLIIVPSGWVRLTAVLGTLTSVGLLTMGSLTARWQQMVLYMSRLFLAGTPLIVSLAVIALGILRLARVQYVTTVLDAAPFGVIFIWILITYALFWWFEYTVNSAAALELLRLLGTDAEATAGRVPYRPGAHVPLNMPADHRWIAPHGIGRFVALGWCRDKDSGEPVTAFQAFDFVELFSRLTPAGAEDRRNDLRRRVQLYFLALNAVAGVAFLAYLAYYGHADRANTVEPVITARASLPSDHPASLEALLIQQARAHRPAIIVAASGGGTRAALFTATALEGLAKLGVGRDIVLLSGVSGGGVAVAYFYAHGRGLLAPSGVGSGDGDWSAFKVRMTEPFIGDVLEGAAEWRVVSRNALGTLLAESFARQLFDAGGLQRVGDAGQPALILNTTITGHPQEDSVLLRDMFSLSRSAHRSCDRQHRPYANISGGRLIFTNLQDRKAFPEALEHNTEDSTENLRVPDVRLPYVVVQDPQVTLASAAALNANFPPVFTNARVIVPAAMPDPQCPSRSYYVTDGGATENLGLLSALYALRQALSNLQKTAPDDIPEIHLVLLEASATTYDYTPDRGINAASGGSKERLTGGLTTLLLEEIAAGLEQSRASIAPIQIHDLALPLAFRSRGGFGTHWMFPDSIEIANPRTPLPAPWHAGLQWWRPKQRHRTVSLDRDELLALWTQLHDPEVPFCAGSVHLPKRSQSMQTVADWVCGNVGGERLPADLHVGQWQKLVAAMAKYRTGS